MNSVTRIIASRRRPLPLPHDPHQARIVALDRALDHLEHTGTIPDHVLCACNVRDAAILKHHLEQRTALKAGLL